jgi:hypothetical protein
MTIPGLVHVCAVTHCVDYQAESGQLFPTFVAERFSGDRNLYFHTSRGGKIVGPVANFNPLDTKNVGYGVLIQYTFAKVAGAEEEANAGLIINPHGDEVYLAKATTQLLGLDVLQANCPALTTGEALYDAPWFEIGLDSLSIVEFHQEIESAFNITFEVSLLFAKNTLNKLAEYLAATMDGHMPTRTLPSYTSDTVRSRANTGASTMYEGNLARDMSAITGIGLRFPDPTGIAGPDGDVQTCDELWAAICGAKATHKIAPTLRDPEMFDGKFFGFSDAEVHALHPQQRWALEVSFAALRDANLIGDVLPASVAGQRVGVFVGAWEHHKPSSHNSVFDLTGHSNTIIANRLSYILTFMAPASSWTRLALPRLSL